MASNRVVRSRVAGHTVTGKRMTGKVAGNSGRGHSSDRLATERQQVWPQNDSAGSSGGHSGDREQFFHIQVDRRIVALFTP